MDAAQKPAYAGRCKREERPPVSQSELSTLFFLQMAVIIATCRVVGWMAKRWLGQPQVVGEMIAGVVLGPSLFGALAPDLSAMLFPAESKKLLYVGAQLGVGLYMFLVGLTFDREEFRASAGKAAAVSLGGMLAPFAAAAALVPWLMQHEGLFSAGVSAGQASLFLGAAIAITAFPMLARIIHERGLAGTRLGTLSLSAGAMGDAGAWLVVALVLASVGGSSTVAVKALGGGIGFAMLMVLVAPRLLTTLGRRVEAKGMDDSLLALVLGLFLLCAFAMDGAGMHAVFGGFLLGTAMPRGALADGLRARLEPFATTFLLPMFFTFSGLNTRLQVLGELGLVWVTFAILATAVLAKGGACYVAARWAGENHRDALGIGALMNARGLMELIIINIGLQAGIIGKGLFAMLVLMAIVTTLMAAPLFALTRARE
jgi:Kef-type K+ transport system membrane component KefB